MDALFLLARENFARGFGAFLRAPTVENTIPMSLDWARATPRLSPWELFPGSRILLASQTETSGPWGQAPG
jgi:hypothetical protein